MDKYSREFEREWDARLWMWILKYGGLHRDRERWDSRLSVNENRRNFRYLDRANGQGFYLDRLAREIEVEFPEYGISDSESLWSWLQNSRIGAMA